MPDGHLSDDASPYESASVLKRHHAELLEKLDRLLGQDSDPDSEITALRRMEGEIRAFLRSGAATGALVEDIRERTACQVPLDFWASTLSHAGILAARPRLAAFDVGRLPDLSDRTCPFVGLDAFRDPTFFFGRAPAVENLLARVADVPLVVVQGASGSGKSSIVMGGVLPALTKCGGGSGYRVVGPLTPGNRPIESLVEVIATVLGEGADKAAVLQALSGDPAQLPMLLGDTGAADVLLVVDQFEEVFTLCDEADRSALVDAIGALLEARRGNRIVLTVREEFAAKLETLERLRGHLASNARFSMSAWPMGYDDLRAAIEQPAAMVNLQFAPGIVDEMVKSVLGHDTALPLLQYALSELWRLRDRNRITREVYAKIGGSPVVALERATEAFYASLIHEEKVEVERILVELVFVDALLEPYRRPVLRSRLLAGGTPRTAGLLERLERNHLVRTMPTAGRRDAAVEVKHEALLRNWPRFLNWIQQKRERVRQRIALTEAAQRWFDEGCSATRGLIEEWRLDEVKPIVDLNEVEQQYLQASVDAADREREARDAALVRRERRKLLWTTVGLVVVAAVVAAAFLERQRQDKQLNVKLREMVKLQMLMGGGRAAATDGRLDDAIVGAIQAVDGVHKLENEGFDDTKALRMQAFGMLQSSLRAAADVHNLFVSDRGPLVSVSLAPAPAAGAASAKGLLAYAGSDDSFNVYDAAGNVVRKHLGCPNSVTTAVAFAPSGRALAAGCEDGAVSIWAMNEAGQPGERPLGGGPLQVLRGKVWTVAFSPDGGMVAVGGRENAVRLLALPEAGQPDEIAAIVVDGASPKGYVWSAAFAPSGESLLVGDGVGKVLRCAPVRDETAWRCEDVPAARRRGDAIRALAYSRDAAMVAMGTWNGEVSVWDADFAREEKVSLRGTEGPVHSLVFFDACGGQALAVGKGNDLRYSLIPRADAPAESNGCRTRWKASVGDEVYALAFDAGTRRIVAATRGGYVVVVDPLHSDSDQLRNGAPGVTSKSALRGAILADGASTALLAVPAPRTRAQQANLELFRVVRGRFDRGSEPKAIPAGDGEIVRLSASRASRRLATIEKAADGGGIRVAVWQFDEGFASLRLLKSLTASDFDGKAPMRIALSPDGQQIAVAFFGTDRVLWSRLEAGTAPRWIDAGLVVKEIAFSFDGRHFAAGGGPTEPAGEAADFDRVQVWDAGRGGPPAKIGAAPWRVDASAGKVFELAFAADERDGAQLLVGTARSIERWTVPEGLRLEPLRVGPRAVFRIAFSPERSLVGAADAGNTVWVWDTSSWLGTRLTPDDESAETPGLLAFGGAGRWIANGARGLQVWDLDLESLKQKVCRLLPRPAEGNAGTDRPPSRPDAPCAAN